MEWIIGLPALGHTAEGGTVREWLKRVGDPVRRAEPVVVVESDKVSLEIEAPADGFLAAIAVSPGSEVPTGTVLGKVTSSAPSDAPAAAAVPAAPAAAVAAAPAAHPAAPLPQAGKARPRSTPLARRIAEQAGLDIATVKGSGRHGEIRRADVDDAIRARAAALPPAPLPAATATPAPAAPPLPEPAVVAGLSPMRRAISRRMVEAWRNQPMVTLSRRVDVTALATWRSGLAKPAGMTAVLAALMGRCLARHPRLNGTIEEKGLTTGGPVNLAVAVALDDGLIAPVLRAADSKSLAVLDAELASLIYLARSGRLGADGTADATASLSNLGSFGIESFTPILTPPQICVLGIGAIERNLRETEGGFQFRSELHLSLTIDHRAVDGADGARFLQDFATMAQAPDALLTPLAAS